MGINGPSNREPHKSGGATLGDVLYANESQTFVPETDWLRLVRLVGAGDEDALHALYERTHHIVFTLVVRITQDRETSEEITVDVFHDVWRRAASYDPVNGTVVGWIMNQARSRAIDRIRFENRKKRVNPYPHSPSSGDEENHPDPHHVVDMNERRRVLRQALKLLNRAEREAIEIAFFGDCTYSEVAERLNEPVGTIKTRVRSGLGKLRQALAPEGGV
jgi:RNA polymerase sigma-70 factor (ECF subfamily)